MSKKLIYKTALGTIEIIGGYDAERIKNDLKKTTKEKFIASNQASAIVGANAGRDPFPCNKRVEWANTVDDFLDIPDDKILDLVACDVPKDAVYSHWLDDSLVPLSDNLIDSWSDIDAVGKISYDLNKAKEIVASRLAIKIKENRGKKQELLDNGYADADAEVLSSDAKINNLTVEASRLRALTINNVSDLDASKVILDS